MRWQLTAEEVNFIREYVHTSPEAVWVNYNNKFTLRIDGMIFSVGILWITFVTKHLT